ncbi:MAG: hypothetical protein ACI8TA_000572 [Cyclobacteriaceae bacterium]
MSDIADSQPILLNDKITVESDFKTVYIFLFKF